MTKPRSTAPAAASRRVSAPLADAAASAFERLGAAGVRLFAVQTQFAVTALAESSARYVERVNLLAQNSALLRWPRLSRPQAEHVLEPVRAWIEAVAGLQTVLLEALMQGTAMLAAADLPRPAPSGFTYANRRVASVVIPFPDRRAQAA
ncbi:MAG: hypothetical protein PHY45_04675 [Rhodocyclaceae bacterium]|nr:hypothetical protein [Rhodocyclaceae bacterium]